MRAVVDANVWISALINPAGAPAQILAALRDERFTLVASETILAELAGVLARPRFANRFGVTPAMTADLLAVLRERAEIVAVTGGIRMCRDPDDDVIIETALSGRADALVTRDDDLKAVNELAAILAKRGVSILTVRRFLVALGSERTG